MHDLAYTSMTLAFMSIVLAFTASVTLFAGSLLWAIVRDIHNSVRARQKYGDDL